MSDPTIQPPLGGVAPALQCNRLMNDDFDNPVHCGKPAEWHIIWDTSAENGIACQEHTDEARRRWVFVGCHRYTEACSIAGARWLPEQDICVVDDDDLGLHEPVLAAIEGESS